MLRKAAREVAVVAFYFALAMAMTWPLALQLHTALADLGDPLVNMWIVDWVCHALTHAPWHLYESPLYYPGHLTLAYSENLIGVALFVLPLHLFGAHPIVVYNVALLLGFAWSGYGAFVLARLITRNTAASLIAGVIFAFVPFKFDHLSHMQLLWSGWIPLLLAAVIAYWRKPTWRMALLVSGAFVMNGLTNVHYFLFGSFAALITAIGLAKRGAWLKLICAFAIGGIVLLPFLLPYRIVSKELGMVRTEADAISGSAPLHAWLAATPRNILYGDLGPPEIHRHEFQLFPGLVAILLAAFGLLSANVSVRRSFLLDAVIVLLAILTYIGAVTTRTEFAIGSLRLLSLDSADIPATLLVIALVIRFRHALRVRMMNAERWSAVVWIVIGFLGSLGMSTFFHAFLFRRIAPFQAVRAPVRWAVIAYVGLAVWAAIGAMRLLEGKKYKRTMAAMLIAIAALDLWPRIRWEQMVAPILPVYRWVNEAPFIELPTSDDGAQFKYLLGSTAHHLTQFNGIENVGTPVFKRIRAKGDAHEYDDELLTLLEHNGCKLIVIHAHDFDAAGRAWLAKHLSSGRIAFLRSFDHEVGGDFVFAVTRNLRNWQRLRGPETPDGAGHLPQQKLARMLAGRTVHSDAILLYVESPTNREVVRGKMQIRGWTLSPFGIRRVTIRLHGGKVKIDAPQLPRNDVKALYHWYYFVQNPGFAISLERPDGVPRETDVQIEVEDHKGRITRSPDVLVEWF